MGFSIVVPTFNESQNVGELARRLEIATANMGAEILFVDDSTDDTPNQIRAAAATSSIPITLIHRDSPDGGLGGAVVAGIVAASNDWVVVMDGDLQHPPEIVPLLFQTGVNGKAEIVVASRYVPGGDATGLSNRLRHIVSTFATLLTRAMFPSRLRDCSDPMTGFFMIRRSAISLEFLEPRGFKILLEIIARQPRRVRIVEVPFTFADRFAGSSKATLTQGARFIRQLIGLRFGRMLNFALVGGLGAVANVAIVAGLVQLDVEYLIAAIVAAEITIMGNYFLQERFVFRDLLAGAGSRLMRFTKSVGFNHLEAALRLPLLYFLVESWSVASVSATAISLAIAFVARYVFHALVVYAPPRGKSDVALPAAEREGP